MAVLGGDTARIEDCRFHAIPPPCKDKGQIIRIAISKYWNIIEIGWVSSRPINNKPLSNPPLWIVVTFESIIKFQNPFSFRMYCPDSLGGLASTRTDLSVTALNKLLLPGLKTFLNYLWYPIKAKTYSFQNLKKIVVCYLIFSVRQLLVSKNDNMLAFLTEVKEVCLTLSSYNMSFRFGFQTLKICYRMLGALAMW